ncbi:MULTISPECIES: FAD-binding protein [unclassified Sphingomonas]|uniref:FAD-binding protein n=1 Tax=unclassified Sphingomonas TaxID=196159 RepID=UPI0006F56E72|nr:MULTISPECIES: FAD-binding protein [unclassified Sphingomonas]KQX18735.1 FAD-linked oxidase [Sphingomonas sp. Root1294]KQY71941.1 FAD-linked oxidase [Sphingomonas sp. Root50]KRB94794.1 FAD-linked oxidase [Sphingomonas sp. Root720]
MIVHSPATVEDLEQLFTDAAGRGGKLELRGGGSKAAIGAARPAEIVDLRGFAGVVDYDPPELVLTVRPGTPLVEVERLVAEQGQMLAFEPFDHGPLFGAKAGGATIGGIVAAGVAGSGRLTAGGARDHLLGFTAVSGRGERFVAGGKVVKNVTGYDLPKLVAGSWGRLAAITELTLKVLPRPKVVRTMAIEGLGATAAQAAMAEAMGSPAEIGAAAHRPPLDGRPAMTLFRVQGFAPSVEARCATLPRLLERHGRAIALPADEAAPLWSSIGQAGALADAGTLWRISLPPSAAPRLVETFEPLGGRWLLDWAGGLLWLGFDGDPTLVRRMAEMAGGHAMLVRAPIDLRDRIPAQHPRASGVMALEARVRRAFDPAGIFETGRFLDHADAH